MAPTARTADPSACNPPGRLSASSGSPSSSVAIAARGARSAAISGGIVARFQPSSVISCANESSDWSPSCNGTSAMPSSSTSSARTSRSAIRRTRSRRAVEELRVAEAQLPDRTEDGTPTRGEGVEEQLSVLDWVGHRHEQDVFVPRARPDLRVVRRVGRLPRERVEEVVEVAVPVLLPPREAPRGLEGLLLEEP